MRVGVILLNFGEPERPERADVAAYLERIFLANMRLEPAAAAAARARDLAERRAPGLLAEYAAMGGSPLNPQTEAQADALRRALADRGRDVDVRVGMQFTDPDIPTAVAAARDRGADRLIGFSLHPLCGPSTTVAALAELRAAVDGLGWDAPITGVSGWHTRPGYTALRADGVRRSCRDAGIDLADPGTRLLFSAHGTPVRYIREGSRYDAYVEDHCRRLGDALGVDWTLGYQNHANRPDVEWTAPDIDDAVAGLDGDRVVVVPVSFMQEHSETLRELDHDLRTAAGARGLAFHRVPVPHDDPRFPTLIADLLEPLLDGDGADPGAAGYRACRCASGGAVCLNRGL